MRQSRPLPSPAEQPLVQGIQAENFELQLGQQQALPEFIGKSMEGCEWWVREGMQGAMNKFNRKEGPAPR